MAIEEKKVVNFDEVDENGNVVDSEVKSEETVEKKGLLKKLGKKAKIGLTIVGGVVVTYIIVKGVKHIIGSDQYAENLVNDGQEILNALQDSVPTQAA